MAIAVADRMYMLENSIYGVLSPEGFASILWKDGSRAQEASGIMKITAGDLLPLGIIDGIIQEPPGGAHRDFQAVAGAIREILERDLADLGQLEGTVLTDKRYERFRSFGAFAQ